MRAKHFFETRLDLRATSASSLSVACSGDLGVSFPQETRLAVSAASQTTQYKVNTPVSGAYCTLRVRDDSGGNWSLGGVTLTGRLGGQA